MEGNLNRRIGNFAITRSYIENNPEDILLVMAECIVIGCWIDGYKPDEMEYTVLSYHFDELEESSLIPRYTVIINQNNMGNKSVEFRRIKDVPRAPTVKEINTIKLEYAERIRELIVSKNISVLDKEIETLKDSLCN